MDAELYRAIEEHNLVTVARLFRDAPESFRPDAETGSPIHLAATIGSRGTVEFLLNNGAEISAVDASGYTPLHVAGSAEIAELLLSRGADLEATASGWTPLQAAAGRAWTTPEADQIASVLLAHGAVFDLHSAVLLGRADRVSEILETDPLALEKAEHGAEFLYQAVERQHREVVELLLQHGADPNACDRGSQESALHQAVSGGDNDIRIVELLIKHGANVRAADENGMTALTIADLTFPEAASMLRRHGARDNPDVKRRIGNQINDTMRRLFGQVGREFDSTAPEDD